MELAIIWKIVIALLIAVIAAALAHIVDLTRNKITNSISFRESMDLTDLPVVTFRQGKDRFNFLLDTGSSLSVINEKVLDFINHTTLDYKGSIYGMEGNTKETSFVNISLAYKDKEYEEEFQVVDMSAPFNKVKQDSGVIIHGILGNSFFTKYEYVLDFKELIAYSKK